VPRSPPLQSQPDSALSSRSQRTALTKSAVQESRPESRGHEETVSPLNQYLFSLLAFRDSIYERFRWRIKAIIGENWGMGLILIAFDRLLVEIIAMSARKALFYRSNCSFFSE
jgi:hypothetical protein